jgi:HEAT repeat protein
LEIIEGDYHMKKLYSVVVALLVLVSASINAQENRTLATTVGDALGKMPAITKADYAKHVKDIASTGNEGLKILLQMLAKEDDSLTKVEYAIDGLVKEATAPDYDKAERAAIKSTIKAEIEKCPEGRRKEFLVGELMIMGEMYGQKNATTITNSKYDKELEQISFNKLIKSLKSSDLKTRYANLYNYGPKYIDQLGEALPSLKGDVKTLVVWYLGEQKAVAYENNIVQYLKSADMNLRSEAAWAVTKMSTGNSLSALSEMLKNDDAESIDVAVACLKSYPGSVAAAVAPLFAQVNDKAKAGIISIFGSRRATKFENIVIDNLNSQSSELRSEAYASLKSVVQLSDLDKLYTLLESAPQEHVADVQAAILAAVSSLDRATNYKTFIARKGTVSPSKQSLYWPLIVATANTLQLLDICKNAGDNGELQKISFDAYIKSVVDAKEPGAQRLLRYKAIMQYAVNAEQRSRLLTLVGQTETFLGIIYAGEFLEDKELSRAASNAVATLATADLAHHGPQVTALLKRAAEVIDGPDANYTIDNINNHLNKLPKEEGFVSMFNGKDLSGWQGMIGNGNPILRNKLSADELAVKQVEANKLMEEDWKVRNGQIEFVGKGYDNLCSIKKYGDFEMYVDWMLYPGDEPDAGIYLRGAPQVQIWDTSRVNVGAQVGSGGLYNNKVNKSDPLMVADNGVGQWNSFYIKMVGERVTVYLNGYLVTDDVVMENYWDRSLPIFTKETIELQAHGSHVAFKNLYIKELPSIEPSQLTEQEKEEGFEMLFDGTSLHKWQGNKVDYTVEGGTIAVRSKSQGSSVSNLYTNEEYSDFIFRFEFKLTKGANNGIGVRAPLVGDAAYLGYEIQVLDHFDAIYQPWLKEYQYHGSVYGIIPTHNPNCLRPVGEWNEEEIYMKGDYVRVTLNGVVITEGNLSEASKNGTLDGKDHPGLKRSSGYVGFLGHGDDLWYRNVRIKRL